MLSELIVGNVLSFDAFIWWLLLGPLETCDLDYYDPYSPGRVVSFVKGAVPPLTNFFSFLKVGLFYN